VLRRASRVGEVPAVPADQIRFDDLVISQSRGTVLLAGHPGHLTPTEYRLLVALTGRPDEVFSRETLGKLVWGYDDIGTGHLIDVHIGRLRLKLRRASSSGIVIVTVRGKGYKIGTGSSSPAGEGESDDNPRSSSGSLSR
jgi:DNA-binding response OmpR family regulator